MKLLVAGILVLLTTSPAHAINKCTGSDGKIVYQDAPCAGKGEAITVRPASGSGDATAAADAQGRIDAMRADNEMAAAIREKRPMVGMTVKQLNEAMGLATLVNTDMSTGTMREQAIFERPNETWYVYTRNGRVESFQHRPGQAVGHGGRQQRNGKTGPCPSTHEINNAITSATSISLTPQEREARWKVIREMQACR